MIPAIQIYLPHKPASEAPFDEGDPTLIFHLRMKGVRQYTVSVGEDLSQDHQH